MKVFVSWSGRRSRHLADALRLWLPRVIQSLKPWMSDEDIAAGSRWLPEIAGELGQAKVGILCVTPENQFNPWLVFEAGALSKTIEQTFVCPMLFDMTASQLNGPLAQFQASTFERAGVFRVLQNLNSALGSEHLPDSELLEIFEVWWPKLVERITATPEADAPTVKPRTTDDLLEEILSLNREQLRRENLRMEHSQARDKRLEEVIPMFEQMATSAKQMQERGRALAGGLGRLPVPPEFQQLLTTATGNVDDVLGFMREQSQASRIETEQLLTPTVAPGQIGPKT